MNRFVATAAVLAVGLLLSPPVRAAGEPTVLTYEIRKEGEPIGRERVSLDREGESARVQVETHTKARVLFMDFHYDHRREERWQDGRLVRMVADTDDDGTRTHTEAERGGGAWAVRVNGEAGQRPAEALPLTLWSRAIVGHGQLFGVIDAKPYAVEVVTLGTETIPLPDGGSARADHVRVSGDIERDLWYGPDGLLLRATFTRAGYPIEMVRLGRK